MVASEYYQIIIPIYIKNKVQGTQDKMINYLSSEIIKVLYCLHDNHVAEPYQKCLRLRDLQKILLRLASY